MLQCLLCAAAADTPALCAPCRADLEYLHLLDPCECCGQPQSAPRCTTCAKTPLLDAVRVTYKYQPPLDALVLRYKYGGQWQLASTLAQLMPPPPAHDVALPVPLHPKREQWRGFNQARELAKRAHLHPQENMLTRITNTTPQAELSDKRARQQNIRGAFQAAAAVRGLSVLLVDDVMTSGATIWEAARTLRKAGAKSVSALLLARTVL